MARKWGATRKRAAGGRRRRRSREEEEEEDDEYVAEEEEEEEEEESVNSEDSDGEESFEFIEETSSDESDEVAVPKRRCSGGGVRKKQRKMDRVSDEDEAGESRVNRSQRLWRTIDSCPVDDEGNDDEDFCPDVEDDEEETMSKGNRRGRKRKMKASKRNVRKRKKSAVAVPARRRGRIEEDPVGKKRRRRRKKGSSDSESSDPDFVVSDDDSLGISDPLLVASDVEDLAVRDRVRVVKDGPKKKKRSVRRNNRRLLNSGILGFDCVMREKDAKEAGNGVISDVPKIENGKEKGKSLPDSETSDSDYVVSDDEIGVMSGSDSDFDVSGDDFIARDRNKIVIEGPQKKSRAARRTDTIHKPRNQRRLLNSNALSFDRVVRVEDSRDVAIGDVLDVPQLKSKEKGKEKAADVLEKQVCGICLSEENKETVQGVLDCCLHYFCFACIMDWSKVESKCPVCKRRFKTIRRTTRSDPWFGFRNAVVNVPKRDQVYQPTVEEIRSLIDPYENVVCMVCQQGCHANLMLLCDICDSPAHTYCVGLEGEIPEGNWYCDGCRTVDDGSPNSQVPIDQGTSSINLFSTGLEAEDLGTNMHANTSSQQLTPLPGQTSSQIFDLNESPRHLPVENRGVASLATFTSLSTLSGLPAPEQQRCLRDARLRQTEISLSESPSLQAKDAVDNQETGNSVFSSGGRETQNLSSNLHGNASRSAMTLSGHSSLQNIDLNVSSRNISGEDHGLVSQASGSGALTLSGRRARHRIDMLISDSRLRELFHRTYVPSRNVERM